ncbi:hypothetical protein CEH05_05855 [Halobacillus halophilus]|uniref:Uncharacterized protein n=1 Tax=Halobacillus halophilus (strain ATCC 35676 / DSM 2266 / JCM 20832 / KCTC 3685 / LMG 17431 / NBRC 102448 / NCIMB 2269) TaxID=866895 RepID=I0JK37_HALH3|nr:hypothetical protein CEH05_05855 [Halobacillus halophilus]CCG44506.1 hypothetical protein HBHAL_2152 [Halobacillus halophilus DSM 2266]
MNTRNSAATLIAIIMIEINKEFILRPPYYSSFNFFLWRLVHSLYGSTEELDNPHPAFNWNVFFAPLKPAKLILK